MEVSDAIRFRRSIRRYKDDEIPDEYVEKILWAGQLAPSAGNLQGREFVVTRDAAMRENICDAALKQRFIKEAPVCIVICTNLGRSKRKYGKRAELYVLQDAAASAMNMMLQAVDLGLGTCWVGAFDEKAVAEVLGLPVGIRPVAILPVGVPDEIPSAPTRLWLDIVHHERW
ncbi:MAG TPA: nitroreductase family protein [Methanocella sp.]|nr:nitroreductase family protein [Methanocella sp.]